MGDNPNYTIIDPRPIAAEARYTFFLPHENELAAIRVGDLVKITFEWEQPVEEYGAERMWVTVLHLDGDILKGTLENEPTEANRLHKGAPVTFHRYDILSVSWSDPQPTIIVPEYREYWERCLVDDCVLYGETPVEYIYREQPDLGKSDDQYPDSGWRIRGRQGNDTDKEMEKRKSSYVALGAVLNKDDSWLSFIDATVGSAFMRDVSTGHYAQYP